MKNYSDTIELINQYINQTLSPSEVLEFNSRLESDSEFNAIYQEQFQLIQGIKRIGLKQEIQAGKQWHWQAKWFRILGVSGILIALLVITWLYFNNEASSNNQQFNKPVSTQISDSIPTETKLIKTAFDVNSIITETNIQSETESQIVVKKTPENKVVKFQI